MCARYRCNNNNNSLPFWAVEGTAAAVVCYQWKPRSSVGRCVIARLVFVNRINRLPEGNARCRLLATHLLAEAAVPPTVNKQDTRPRRPTRSAALLAFLPREAMHKRCLCHRAVAGCPSVCLSRSSVLQKKAKLILKHPLVAPSFQFSVRNIAKCQRGPLNGGIGFMWGMENSQVLTNISLYLRNDIR